MLSKEIQRRCLEIENEEKKKVRAKKIDELVNDVESKYISGKDEIINIPITEIQDYPDHPFKIRDDESMQNFVESVKEYGVMLPAIVRKLPNGKYEMISGHRRKRASELAGKQELICIVKDLTDEEAVILMVDTNIQQREEILPSERAFAYKMKMEAISHQGKSLNESLGQDGKKINSADNIGKENNESGRQVHRYIRLTELVPEILSMVDEKKIAFTPAVELSYLTYDEQYMVLDFMQRYTATPSLAQAIHLKGLSQEGVLTAEKIDDILGEEKPNQIPKYTINYNRFEKVLPRDVVTAREVEDYLFKCAEEKMKRERNKNLSR